jgi:DNA-directed RNA polymerase subunit RPC12/RpoP
LFWLFVIADRADQTKDDDQLRKIEVDDHSQLTNIDVEKRTTRGRACPICGGKIIPSDRAVYQNTADPNAVYPLWQCERCGYQELVERVPKAAKKH